MDLIEQESVKLINDSEISSILINRPQTLNALNPDVLVSLGLIIEKLSKNQTTKVLIISGAGEKAFVAGADIAGMHQLGPRAIADYIELGQRVMRSLEVAPFPVIAAVNGYALGGGLELALSCDIVVASENSKFGQPEVNLGIIPGFGGTQRLIHRCGIGVARRLTYTGDIVDANEALRIGLIDKLVSGNELLSSCQAIAGNICSKAPLAIRKVKEVIRVSQDGNLLSGLRHEVAGFLDLFSTWDREEGMMAFLQKRSAKFMGK
jgi:enoyl-CoA hydratase